MQRGCSAAEWDEAPRDAGVARQGDRGIPPPDLEEGRSHLAFPSEPPAKHALPCGNPAWPLTNGLQLPLREQAEIPPAKLRDYALNPEHEEGRHKARVFAAALGIRREHWAYLRDQILRALESAPVTGVRLAGPWGMLYEVRIDIDGLNGQTHPIITVWFSRDGIGAPTLTTTYVDVP